MKLLVNADDFGMSHEKNIAVDKMMRLGVCTNTSLVVNMPYAEEAVRLAVDGKYADKVSLHLNMTEGVSLTKEIRNVDLYYADDKFSYRPILKVDEQIYPEYITEIRAELEAQITRFLEWGFCLESIDSHNWIHLRMPVWLALKPLLKKYSISIVRPMWIGYKRPEIASEKWCRYFREVEPLLLECPKCRVIGHTSNIEQFLLKEEENNKYSYVEVFTHPEVVNGEIIDMSSSYLGMPKGQVKENVALLRKYDKVTVKEILGKVES